MYSVPYFKLRKVERLLFGGTLLAQRFPVVSMLVWLGDLSPGPRSVKLLKLSVLQCSDTRIIFWHQLTVFLPLPRSDCIPLWEWLPPVLALERSFPDVDNSDIRSVVPLCPTNIASAIWKLGYSWLSAPEPEHLTSTLQSSTSSQVNAP